jgi:nicotinamidase-related amidase
MEHRLGKDVLLGMLLQGMPERVLSAASAASPEDTQDLRNMRESLALYALASPPVEPSPALRARLLGARPRPRRPKKPVLAVLDMIQDHLTPGRPLEVPRARDIVPALQARIREARQHGIPIVYICDTHPPDDPDFKDWPIHAVEGTPGSEVWPALAPEPGDHIVRKRTYSGFTGSNLLSVLDSLGADHIILTGCATEIGLTATATDALQKGFVVTIPPDCQAGSNVIAEQVALLSLSTMPPFEPRYLR